MCPKGDDPWTLNQYNRRIGLIITSLNNNITLYGHIGIKLYGITSYISINGTNEECKFNLENSTQIESVECILTRMSPMQINIDITFLKWPSIGIPENNIYVNNGNPLITDFYCDVSKIILPNNVIRNSTIVCNFYDIYAKDIKGNYLYYII